MLLRLVLLRLVLLRLGLRRLRVAAGPQPLSVPVVVQDHEYALPELASDVRKGCGGAGGLGMNRDTCH